MTTEKSKKIYKEYRGFKFSLMLNSLGHWCAYIEEVPDAYKELEYFDYAYNCPALECFEPNGGWTFMNGLGWDYTHVGDDDLDLTEDTVWEDVKSTLDKFFRRVHVWQYEYRGWKWNARQVGASAHIELAEDTEALAELRNRIIALVPDGIDIYGGLLDPPTKDYGCRMTREQLQEDIRRIVDSAENKASHR